MSKWSPHWLRGPQRLGFLKLAAGQQGGARTGSPASFPTSHFLLLVLASWQWLSLTAMPGSCSCVRSLKMLLSADISGGPTRHRVWKDKPSRCRELQGGGGVGRLAPMLHRKELGRDQQATSTWSGQGERRKLGRLSGGGGARAALKNKTSKRNLLRGDTAWWVRVDRLGLNSGSSSISFSVT